MAIKQELIIEILPDGDVKIKTEGFKGTECEEELKPIEKALGKVTTRTKTSEYYQQSVKKKTNVSNSAE
jgi:hypothetical protein